MSTYAADLANLKHHALHVLFEVLQNAKDHAERRRAATAILRIPDPTPEKNTPGMRRLCDESRGFAAPAQSEPAAMPSESASEPEALIVSPRAVEQGSASDTPGTGAMNDSHSEGVLVAPTSATPTRVHPTSNTSSLPSPPQLIANHPRPAAALRAAVGAPRSLTAPDLPFSHAPPPPFFP